MSMTTKAQAEIRRKLKVLNHVKETGNVSKACRYFGISRETYYNGKRDYESKGETALMNSKPCPQNPKIRIPEGIEEKIIYEHAPSSRYSTASFSGLTLPVSILSTICCMPYGTPCHLFGLG
jgi:transposase-like protein